MKDTSLKASFMLDKLSRKRKRKLDEQARPSIEAAEERERQRNARAKRRPTTPQEWKEYNDRMARRT